MNNKLNKLYLLLLIKLFKKLKKLILAFKIIIKKTYINLVTYFYY